MMSRTVRIALLGLGLGISLVACGGGGKTDGGSGGGRAGGGTGTSGGGTGTSGGGTGATGGGTGAIDAGPRDAGRPADPFDDGGTFEPGDICAKAIPVEFPTTPEADGGISTLVRVDLTTYGDQYRLSCVPAIAAGGADAVFQVTLTEPKSLRVSAAEGGDSVLGINTTPCAYSPLLACQDEGSSTETLSLARLEAGTYFVFLDGYNKAQGAYAVTFSLGEPAPAPANDTCANAAALTFTSNVATVSGTTVGADNSSVGKESQCTRNDSFAGDVVYSFELTQAQDVTITAAAPVASSLSPLTYLRRACDSGAAADEVRCAVGEDPYTVRNLPAGKYFLWVDGRRTSAGAFELTVALSAPSQTPPNDTCAAPVPLTPGTAVTTVLGQANRDYPATCDSSGEGGDTVFSFTTTQAKKVTVTATPGSADDVVVSLRADPCASGTTLECLNEGFSGDPESVISQNLPAGTYFAVVQNSSGPGTDPVSVALTLEDAVLPPANDLCSAPAPLTPATSVTVNLAGATQQARPPSACAFSADGAEVFYSFTLASAQRVTLTATPGTADDVVLQLFAPGCAGAPLNCRDAASRGSVETLLERNLAAGTYVVAVSTLDRFAAATVGLSLALATPAMAPPNDTCTGAVALAPGVSQTVDLAGAARDIPGTSCGFSPTGPDAVYSFTLATAQAVTLTLTPGANDDVGLLLTGSPCGTGAELQCVDVGVSGDAETLTVRNLAAGTYFAVPYAYDPDQTEAPVGLSLAVSAVVPPPTNETCASAAAITFTNNAATATTDLTDAAKQYSAMGCATFASGGEVVYAVTVPPARTLSVVVTPGPALDPVVFIRSSPCDTGTEVDCKDVGASGGAETATVTNSGAAPATYYVFVQAYRSATNATASIAFTLQ